MSPTPNICATVVDGNVHYFTFSFTNFLQIQLKCTLHLDQNLANMTPDDTSVYFFSSDYKIVVMELNLLYENALLFALYKVFYDCIFFNPAANLNMK